MEKPCKYGAIKQQRRSEAECICEYRRASCWDFVYLGHFIRPVLHRPCSSGKFFFFQWDQHWMAQRTKAQEISMGQLVMSKSGSISMLLESCHPSICSLHFTFIHFKSTDMCLPADWLWAIFSCSGLLCHNALDMSTAKSNSFTCKLVRLFVVMDVGQQCPSKCETVNSATYYF